MLYLTSDLHFGHTKVAEYRGYSNPADHDAEIVDKWLKTIHDDDHVWVLGDLAMSHPENALDLLRDLPGTKHLVAGNHDPVSPIHEDSWKWVKKYHEVFESVQAYAKRKVKKDGKKIPVLMSHYPYTGDHTAEERYSQFRLPDKGDWLIHGHTHSESVLQYPHSIHVGWDAWRTFVKWDFIMDTVTGG
jgi:calcineurin-like phosphoesterase family protein